MRTFEVTRKTDAQVVDRYRADSPIEWQGMEFDTHTHTDVSATSPAAPRVTIYGGRRKLTKLEFRALLTSAEQQAIDKFEARFESMPFPEDVKDRIRTGIVKRKEATIMDLDEPDISTGLGLHVALGNLAYSRISEIVNG